MSTNAVTSNIYILTNKLISTETQPKDDIIKIQEINYGSVDLEHGRIFILILNIDHKKYQEASLFHIIINIIHYSEV